MQKCCKNPTRVTLTIDGDDKKEAEYLKINISKTLREAVRNAIVNKKSMKNQEG